jgi:hypothetical protein
MSAEAALDYGGTTPRVGEASGGPIQQAPQHLRFNMVGTHDLLNERVRQKVIDCLGVSMRHGRSPFDSASGCGLTFQPQVDTD